MVSKDIRSISYRDLSIEDLFKSRIPNGCFRSATVSFTSPAGNEYVAVHVRAHLKNPHISLMSKSANRYMISEMLQQ